MQEFDLQGFADHVISEIDIIKAHVNGHSVVVTALENFIRRNDPEKRDTIVTLIEETIAEAKMSNATLNVLNDHLNVLRHGMPPKLTVVDP